MKKNNVIDLIFNPFTKIAGIKALIIGLAFMLLMGFVGALSGTYYDGVIDVHLGTSGKFMESYVFLLIGFLSIVLMTSVPGLIFSKGFRLIDVFGTMALSKVPLLIPALLGFFVDEQILLDLYSDPLLIFESTSLIIFSIFCIPFLIWNIILMYNAFKVSLNIKGNKNIVLFIVTIILAEIISKIIIYYTI